jgi:hypothetical protein
VCLAPAGVLPAAADASIAGPTKVVATPAAEISVAADPGWLAWTQDTATTDSVWARHGSAPKFRVSPRGTYAFADAIDGNRLLYASESGGLPADLFLYDLTTRTRTKLPAPVNSAEHDCCGLLSGVWLLFMRTTSLDTARPTRTMYLYNLVTLELRKVTQARSPVYVQGGGLAGNWAAWTRCPRTSRCDTYVYDIASATSHRIPNPNGRAQYAASLTERGTVYFAESDDLNCGKHMAFWRYPRGGPRKKLIALSPGIDTSVTDLVVRRDGIIVLYFTRQVCRVRASGSVKLTAQDIYKLTLRP